jgi:hypothetical protein
MPDLTTWAIVALFYAPLHFLIPILVVSMRAPDPVSRNRAIFAAAVDCGTSMLLAFALAIWLADEYLQWAVVVLLTFMLLPYLRALRPMSAEDGESDAGRDPA